MPAHHLPSPQICEKQHPPRSSTHRTPALLIAHPASLCSYSVSQSSLGMPLLPLRICCRRSNDPIHTVLSIMQSLLPPSLLYILSLPKVFKTLACCPPLSSTGTGKKDAASDIHRPQKRPYLYQAACCAWPHSSTNVSMSCRALILSAAHPNTQASPGKGSADCESCLCACNVPAGSVLARSLRLDHIGKHTRA